MPNLFTPEERHAVLLCLMPSAKRPERRFWYAAFVLPSLLFALYGLWNRDFLATLVAYVALLTVALMYLSYRTRASDHLRSALEKYEEKVGALREPPQ
jgi:hypothetical protein